MTDADIAAEQAIRAIVAARFPADGFYGEEIGRRALDAEYVWLVDPIDGTKSFVRGYPMFSTQIAVMHRRPAAARRVLGACLWRDRLGRARRRRVARRRAARGERRRAHRAGDALDRQPPTLAGGPRWAAFGRLVARLDRIRGYGDFLHYHLLAAGKIDAVLESDVNILDIAALTVIVEEAGGRVTDLEGSRSASRRAASWPPTAALHEIILAALAA